MLLRSNEGEACVLVDGTAKGAVTEAQVVTQRSRGGNEAPSA